MLKSLHIHNYAIIDEINIDFSPKLNVITGETGAGKSILMGALSLILGDRADTSVLLNREKKCIVEGIFTPDNNLRLKKLLGGNDLECDEELIIRREIAATGKSRAFVNDTPVNLELLKQVSLLLVDLHRQFDTLSLLDSGFQLDVLDALAGNASALSNYQSVYRRWKALQEELDQLKARKLAFSKEYDYNKFLFEELEQAALTENELEDADAELKMLSHAEDIKNGLSQVSGNLSGGEQPLVQQLKSMHHQLAALSKYHEEIVELLNRLHSTHAELQDIADELERLNDKISHDPGRIDQLNDRIAIGYKLLKKHGVQTTAELLSLQREFEQKLQEVMNIDEHIGTKENETAQLLKQLDEAAAKLSAKRNKQTGLLQDRVNKLLTQVGMPNARLKVTMENKTADISGKDAVEFLFDANKSGRFEPVRKGCLRRQAQQADAFH